MNGCVTRSVALSLVLSLLFAAACPAFVFAAEAEAIGSEIVSETVSEIVSEGEVGSALSDPAGDSLFAQQGGSGALFSDEEDDDDDTAADEGSPAALDAHLISTAQLGAEAEPPAEGAASGEEAAAASTHPPTETDEDVVYTAAELSAWLRGHSEGTVTLGANIELNTPAFFSGPVTIDTSVYGLCFNGGYLAAVYVVTNAAGAPALGSVFVCGEGVDQPVVDVQSMGRMFVGDWNNYLCVLDITARGCEGKGGTALRLSQSGSGRVSLQDLERDGACRVRSFGREAVGIEVLKSSDIYYVDVQVEGDASSAVYAHADAGLAFSRFVAVGEGARTLYGTGRIEMDTCAADPFPDEEHIAVYQSNPFAWWLPIAQGSEKPQEIEDWPMDIALMNSSEAVQGLMPGVTWDLSPLDALTAFDELGSITIRGQLASPWLRELIPEAPEMILAVRDPHVPCIEITNTGWDTRLLYFWTCDAWEVADSILWYSADDGATWRDCTADADVLWEANRVTVPESMIDGRTLFVIEVPGFGFSNVARFSHEYGQYAGSAGGDRIGTDRVSVGLGSEGPLPSGAQTEPPGSIDDPGNTDPPGSENPPGAEEPGQPQPPSPPEPSRTPAAYLPPNPPRKNASVQLETIESRSDPVLAAPSEKFSEPAPVEADEKANGSASADAADQPGESAPAALDPSAKPDEPALSGSAANPSEPATRASLDEGEAVPFVPSRSSDASEASDSTDPAAPSEFSVAAPIYESAEEAKGAEPVPIAAETSAELSELSSLASASSPDAAEPLATAALVKVDIAAAGLWKESWSNLSTLFPLQDETPADAPRPVAFEAAPAVQEGALLAAPSGGSEPNAGVNIALVAASAVALAAIGAWLILGRLQRTKP